MTFRQLGFVLGFVEVTNKKFDGGRITFRQIDHASRCFLDVLTDVDMRHWKIRFTLPNRSALLKKPDCGHTTTL